MRAEVEVVRAGALTTVQDRGRTGLAHLGVPRSGALDAQAYALGNRLLGNPPGTASLETTLDGVALRAPAGSALTVAVTGAPCPVRVAGRPAAWAAPVRVPPGALLEVGSAAQGLRSYVAVRGGFAPPEVLGSRSADLLSGLGPPPLTAGTFLPLGPTPETPVAGADTPRVPAPPAELVLPVRLGPRENWFTPQSVAALGRSTYRAAAASNRIGLRTEAGPPLARTRAGELPSEGMVLGAVQVPPDGLPVIFLADHPVTGGYPVLGVVPPQSLDAAAQTRPGTPIRFTLHR
ncbi:5-oxoprolinase subunit C family protein [Streptomyces bambusae]|uniref:5-oxoprolinase/urea amidolyase family protein n=1 Tax=Streptomyces bambusae TaxID=1550616 RepID=A0ABS6ZIP5_9ACTN|nr:biotin-dependent carboxyltransferase family protein [Streptomyces bambusae]MBW5486515.1 5-oxoprolinase/urea amidolyase family protein [Streptomyces bambusae]